MGASDGSLRVPRHLLVPACLLYLAASFAFWMSLESTLATISYYVVFLIPNFLVGHYLTDITLKRLSFMSNEATSFSVPRIILGTLLVCLAFAIGYITWLTLIR